VLYVRRGPVSNASGTVIPRGGAVLAAYGSRRAEVQAIAEGDTVRVLMATLPRLASGAAPALLIGGWPRILQDGRNVAGDAAIVEGTISRNAEVRHPRTAVGISRDARTLLLLVVDGRSARSVGMTLVELAEQLRRVGAWQALNFDGGGSTTMMVNDSIVNVPSDTTGERAVGNALLVVRAP
jgi:exopolysaccharide biosynthesis protein